MINTATVISLSGERATVAVDRVSDCSGCETCPNSTGCPNSTDNKRAVMSEALNPVGAQPGDRVEIFTPDSRVASLLFAVFIAPIAIPVAAYVVFERLFNPTAGYIAMAAFFIAVLCAVFALDRLVLRGKTTAKIVRVIGAPEEVNNFKESGI